MEKLRPGRLSHSPNVKGKGTSACAIHFTPELAQGLERVKLGSSHTPAPSLAASSSLEALGGKTIVVLVPGLLEGLGAPFSESHNSD